MYRSTWSPASLKKVIENKILPCPLRSKGVSNKIKSFLIKYFFPCKKDASSLITLNGSQKCFSCLIHFFWSKFPQRNSRLMKFADSRLCIFNCIFNKAQNTNSSQSDMYLTSLSIHWLECCSTWLPEMQRNSDQLHHHCKLNLLGLFCCTVGRLSLKIRDLYLFGFIREFV